MFGFQRRFVRRCECDTDMPHEGFLPHTSHTEAMVDHSVDVDRRPSRHEQDRQASERHRDHRTAGRTCAVPTLERPLERSSVDALRDTVVDVPRPRCAPTRTAINRLNVYPVPDGDTGTNMARTLDAVVAEMEAAPGELAPTCDAISHGSLMGARGNSGVILSQILRGIAATLKGRADARRRRRSPTPLAAASTAAYQAVLTPSRARSSPSCGRAPTRRARRPTAGGDAGRSCCARPATPGGESLARTPDLLPVLADAGVVDAGGAGFLLLLDAALHVVDGEPLPEPPPTTPAGRRVVAVVHAPSTASSTSASSATR